MDQQPDTPDEQTVWLKSMETLLGSVDDDYIQSYSISIVPEGLKESTEDAYMPRVVSMGPRFKGSTEELLLMEEVKIRCMLHLLHRPGKQDGPVQSLRNCSTAIWKLDEEIRASYVADIHQIKRQDLAKIMLVDGCFLLELLISKESNAQQPYSWNTPPSPALQVLKNEDVLSDLTLFENQIPICVLHDLSRTLFPDVFEEDLSQRATRINNLLLSILGYSLPQVQSIKSPHILDVVHFFVNRNSEGETERRSINGNHVMDFMGTTQHQNLKLKRCASRLQAAGVTIKVAHETNSGLSCFGFLRNCFGGILVRLGNIIMTTRKVDMLAENVRGLDFEFKFENGKLEIAQLHITKTTKAKWRNVIAWEHHKKKRKSSAIFAADPNGKFTSAALIFDGLICCAADVKILKDKNIIVDHVKRSNEELEKFFRTMSLGVDHGVVDSSYVEMVGSLNTYSQAFFIKRMWKLFSHVFSYRLEWFIEFMKQNYNFVATLLAILTAVQTAYGIVAYHDPK